MFCVLLYARVSLSIYSLALDFFLELGITGDSACLVICSFQFSCSISVLVFINFYLFEMSIVYVFKQILCIMFWEFVIVASWTTIGFYIPLRVILICSVSVILCIWFHLLQIYLQSVILNYSSQTCVDYCRFEWSKIVGRYSWYQSFGFRQTLAYGAKTH